MPFQKVAVRVSCTQIEGSLNRCRAHYMATIRTYAIFTHSMLRSNYVEISRPGADDLIVFSPVYQAPCILGTITSKGLYIIIAYRIPLQTRRD